MKPVDIMIKLYMSIQKVIRHLLKKIQDTRNIVHQTIMPQSLSK